VILRATIISHAKHIFVKECIRIVRVRVFLNTKHVINQIDVKLLGCANVKHIFFRIVEEDKVLTRERINLIDVRSNELGEYRITAGCASSSCILNLWNLI